MLSKRLSQQATLRGQLADQMEVDQEACQLSPGKGYTERLKWTNGEHRQIE